MTFAAADLAVKPWYREPWPWLLMAGPCVVVIAGFLTLWLAIRSDDGLVADDYYKRGLAINQTLGRAQRAELLSLGAKIDLDERTQRVHVALTGKGEFPPALLLRLVHPTRAVADELIDLRLVGAGRYEGLRSGQVGGRRVVMLEDLARTWRLAGEASGGARLIELTPQ